MSGAYREAANVLEVVLSRKRGLRTAALAAHVKNKRKVLALVTRTLQNQHHLERAVTAVKGCSKKLQAAVPSRSLRLLLLYDLVLGRGKIDGGGKAARAVKEFQEPLSRLLAPIARAIKAADAAAAAADANGDGSAPTVRFVRVNTLKMTVEAAEEELLAFVQGGSARRARRAEKEGGEQDAEVDSDKEDDEDEADEGEDEDNGQEAVRTAEVEPVEMKQASDRKLVWRDEHVDNLLACLPGKGAEFFSHPRVRDGSWILQDKAR